MPSGGWSPVSDAVITPGVPPSGDAGRADGGCFSTGRESELCCFLDVS